MMRLLKISNDIPAGTSLALALRGLAILAVTLLCACTTPREPGSALQAQTLEDAVTLPNAFFTRPDIPQPADIHRLTAEQRQEFLAWMNNPDKAAQEPHLRMYSYLENVVENFSYAGETLHATTTLATLSGNCMSLAILTTALAEVAGLETDYQLMDDIPVYEFNDQMVKKGVHIRSVIYDPEYEKEDNTPLFARPRIAIDYFPTNRQRFISNMDRQDYHAMYYQNMAVEFLDAGNLDYAYWYAFEALQHAQDYSPAMNTLAVIYRRAGHADTAEAIYQFGIAHANDKLSLLKNYESLLLRNDRPEEARDIRRRLEAIDDPSPSHWYQLARTAHDNGEFREAIRYYAKSLELAPYLHEAHFGIALANHALGRQGPTRAALENALAEAEKVSTRNLYAAKLVSLTRE